MFVKDGARISVEKVQGFGKKPGLWVGTEDPNRMVKVASFGSDKKAELFCKWFKYFLGFSGREEVKWDGTD